MRASFLPGPRTTVAERIDELEAARDRAQRRRGARDRLRLYRAADGEPGAARRHRRRRQSEELDRPARRVHPRDRRRDARLRPHPGRLSRPALRRDQPAHVSGAGARGLAAVADPLPPRQCAARSPRHCARCTRASGWSTTTGADVGDGVAVSVDLSGLGPEQPRRLSRQAPHRADRRRAPRRLRRRPTSGSRSARARDGSLILDPERVLHPRLEGGGAGAARLRRRDGAVRSAGRRVPRALRRLLRSRLRLCRRRRARRARGAGGALARGAVHPRARPDRRPAGLRADAGAADSRSTARASAPTTRRRASSCRSISGRERRGRRISSGRPWRSRARRAAPPARRAGS